MNWFDELASKVSAFLNTDIMITIISISIAFVYILVIFSKTSLGKKLFNRVEKDVKENYKVITETLETCNATKQEVENKVQELKDEYEKKLGVITSYANELENILYQLGDVIPNAKVKKLIDEFKSQKEARIAEISKVVGTYSEFQELTLKSVEIEQEIENRVKAQVEIIENLYKEKFDALIETYQNQLGGLLNGEQENTDTTDEIL